MSTEAKHVAILVNQTSKVCIAEIVYESPLGPPISVVGDSRRGGDVPDVPFVGEHLAVGRAFVALGQGLIDSSLGGLDDALARREAERLAVIEKRRTPKPPDPLFQMMVLAQEMIDQVIADEELTGIKADADREDLHRQVIAAGQAVFEIPEGEEAKLDAAAEMFGVLCVRYSVDILGLPVDDAMSFVEQSLEGRVVDRERIAAAVERGRASTVEDNHATTKAKRAEIKAEIQALVAEIDQLLDESDRMRFGLSVGPQLDDLRQRIQALPVGKGRRKLEDHLGILNHLVLTQVFELTAEQVATLAEFDGEAARA